MALRSRALAQRIDNQEARDHLLSVAEQYEKLAEDVAAKSAAQPEVNE